MLPTSHDLPRADVAGVVLAGGQSTRMGLEKAGLVIAGEPLLHRTTGRLGRAFVHVLVIGPADVQAFVPGLRVVADLYPGLGPLAGLETALAAADTPWVFVVACDMPFVSPALARHMSAVAASAQGIDAVVLSTDRGPEPLHAVYSTASLPVVRRQIAAGQRSLHRLLENFRVLPVSQADAAALDPHGLSAFNANTPADWARAIALAAHHPDA